MTLQINFFFILKNFDETFISSGKIPNMVQIEI